MNRRTLLKATAGAALAAVAAPLVRAQGADQIRLVSGFAAGGTTDTLCRILAGHLTTELGQSVLVETKAGAGGRLAAEYVKRAEPDGRTYLVGPDGWAIFPSAMYTPKELRYDLLNDFQTVAQAVSYPLALAVDASLPVRTLAEYAEWLKANPGQAHFGTPAPNGQLQFVGWMVGEALGVPLQPIVYKGNAPMLVDLLGGRLPAVILTAGDAIKQPEDKVRVLGFMAEERWAIAPNVPTFREQGVEIQVDEAWQALWTPAGSRPEEVARVEQALKRILGREDVRQEIQQKMAVSANFAPGAEVHERLGQAIEHWRGVIARSGYSTVQS